ncbi:MAG: tRNA epoxyqueuosine(34) reductase QueG [Bacteroidaceae bacterium]|nr:tRNA epoxyqueuosine(34) reductase QueG [Bacteroidaceae bacterium]
MTEQAILSQFIKAEALRLGFDFCGIAKAEPVDKETRTTMAQWIHEQRHGTMNYLERNSEKRLNPQLLVPGCKSIICVAINYFTARPDENKLHISQYAQGMDYHKVVKEKLYALMHSINAKREIHGRAFCDTAPLLERYWATRAGIGWIGKNHQLIIPGAGTHFFLGEILVDIELQYDTPFKGNRCGDCRKCLDACPTKALTAERFDARRCLSYLTIEYHGDLPENIGEKMGKCFYGCDKCQTCCPQNRFASPTQVAEFTPSAALLAIKESEWKELTGERYKEIFGNSAVERCGYEQLRRNINAIECKKQK